MLGSIPYPILSDFYPHGEIARDYGVFNDANGAAQRSVFLIDKEGIIRHKEIYAQASDIDIPDLLDRAGKL